MEGFLLYLVFTALYFGDIVADPSQAAWVSRQEARELDCQRLSQADAHARFPGQVPAPHARAQTQMTIDALVCTRRVVPATFREARDEALLEDLSTEVADVVTQAQVVGPARWHVDAFYPDPIMTQKIATAARTHLSESGHRVVQQAPLLAAGDVLVLHGKPLWEALPIACQRFHAEGTLDDDDAWLALAVVDPSETQLHGGVCVRGAWRWLR